MAKSPKRSVNRAAQVRPGSGLTSRDAAQASHYYHEVMREAVRVVKASDEQKQGKPTRR